jgi:protein-disulfide isomerase
VSYIIPSFNFLLLSMENNAHRHGHGMVYAAIALSTIISMVSTYFFVQQPQIDQVGGRENYKLYHEMVNNPKYAENVKQSLESQKQMLAGEQPTAPGQQPTAPEPATTGTLSGDDLTAITKDSYMRGDKSASILWIEYSDLECPFCKRLHDSGAIKNLEAKHGNKLAFVFKHYPLPFHPTALPAALSAECVGELGGSTKFYDFIEKIFVKGTPSASVIDAVITEVGADAKKVKACVDAQKYKAKVDAHMAEGSTKFGVNGTPGNVIINTKTGKYEVISGAQPEANFDAAITRLLAE